MPFRRFFWFLAWGKFFSIFAVLPLLCFCGETLTYVEYATSFPSFLRLIFISKSETSNRVAVSTVFLVFGVGEVFFYFCGFAVALFFCGETLTYVEYAASFPRFFASNFYLQNGLARLVALRAIRAVLAPSG